ncbi:hypothetical protein BO86DRAFT_390460 [Aspergillus japonicus CBS 114.51]|uniref:Uncharacterized protein n=2 Tax=Aspergillus TaxID=5052 RepID=A0A2V5HNY6_ASPV1|nr:hypothetical protein BO86DRAFT_390460 [Aspergillus japonicus CBS 114.51]PYI23283.1 hypothetical protein BO99DRAFT_399211 [Aspergillus violaceofuscus CBS 115571]RAH80270.1 hypothetical protein BO86DRAFT_390460 [Aspergillus japonicus CBS 114.51]
MGSASNFAKTMIIPAVISLTLYLLFSFVIIPFFRRYHQRYSQYLPLHTISAHTLTLRDRIADAIMRRFLPSSWQRQHLADQDDNISIYDEEGEIMVGMDMDVERRGALERQRSAVIDSGRRLSRELEAGFMDDSEDEDEGHPPHSQSRR